MHKKLVFILFIINYFNRLKVYTSALKILIEESRKNVAAAVNSELTMLYWKIGKRISTEILDNTRAAYGKKIMPHCQNSW